MWTEYKFLIIILCAPYIWTVRGDSSKPHKFDLAEETQHAICNISTKDIQTSANASVTRQLKGVCTSKQLDIRFRQLELKIINELEIIKRVLRSENKITPASLTDIPLSTSNNQSYSEDAHSYAQANNYEDIDETKPIFSSFKSTHFKNSDPVDPRIVSPILVIDGPSVDDSGTKNGNKIDSFPRNISSDENVMDEDIIMKFNNTVRSTPNGRVFYYFWKIENFNKLMSKSEMYVRSSSFLVQGHELMIQFHPNQPKQNLITIKLKTSYSFQKKHQFSIIHRQGLRKDIESRLLGNLNGLDQFVVPLKLIHTSGYLVNGSIILTLKIYLEMN